jgi:hypothetical protein
MAGVLVLLMEEASLAVSRHFRVSRHRSVVLPLARKNEPRFLG